MENEMPIGTQTPTNRGRQAIFLFSLRY